MLKIYRYTLIEKTWKLMDSWITFYKYINIFPIYIICSEENAHRIIDKKTCFFCSKNLNLSIN